jgi:hypothetical protein
MTDPTPRIVKVGDALSQLCNVAFLPRHRETNANESISGRCHRMGWRWAEKAIDAVFAWDRDHCRRAVERDAQRARDYLRQIE